MSNGYHLIQRMQQFDQNTIEQNLNDYHSYLDALLYIQNYLSESGINFPEWKYYSDDLVTKHIFHSNTIYNILNGLSIKSELTKLNFTFFDLPSVQVLIRAQLENLLITDFIYFQHISELEKEFRFNCWLYASLLDRSKLSVVGKEIKKLQEQDKIDILKLKDIIIAAPFYKKLSIKQQKTFIEKGDYKLFHSWEDLITLSKLKGIILNSAYKGLCSQAHSGAMGIMNLKSQKLYFSNDNPHVNPIILLSTLILCVMIYRYRSFCKTTEIAFKKLSPLLIKTIELNNSLLSNRSC